MKTKTTKSKHYPEVALGRLLNVERHPTVPRFKVDDKTGEYLVRGTEPGSLKDLHPNNYVLLVNQIASFLERAYGEHPDGKKVFNKQVFFEATGTQANPRT